MLSAHSKTFTIDLEDVERCIRFDFYYLTMCSTLLHSKVGAYAGAVVIALAPTTRP